MPQGNDKYRIARRQMVEKQLMARGISDASVLQAMNKVQRHLFVDEALAHDAYSDRPMPIGYGQTISQPYTVALMTQCLEISKGMSVLEVGTGSGYQSAVLHALGAVVFTVERIPELYASTKQRFESLGMVNIRVSLSDGTMGWREMAPFDRILVAAGGPEIPQSLLEQLADGGIMILPVGEEKKAQNLVRVRREGEKFFTKVLGKTSFVDLIGKQGWK